MSRDLEEVERRLSQKPDDELNPKNSPFVEFMAKLDALIGQLNVNRIL